MFVLFDIVNVGDNKIETNLPDLEIIMKNLKAGVIICCNIKKISVLSGKLY